MKKILLLACVAAIACGDDDVTPMADAGPDMDGGADVITIPDSGPVPDTGPTPDTGPVVDNICDPAALENVTADIGMVVSTTIDTSAATTTPQALEACGDAVTGQVVIAITIAGDVANQIVQVSTLNDGTDEIDTILDFRTECGTEGVCFDDVDGTLFSRGTIIANGGDTVFALISGYGADDVGTVEVTTEILGTTGDAGDACDDVLVCTTGLLCNDLAVCQAPAALGEACLTIACATDLVCGATDVCETAEAPVLTVATTVRHDNVPSGEDLVTSFSMGLTGSDVNGDVVSLNLTLLDAAGDDFDFYGEGGDLTFEIAFDEAAGLDTFMESTLVTAIETAMYPAAAVGFRISLNDSSGLESNEISGTIELGTFAEVGESCAFTALCDPALACGLTEECETPEAPVLSAASVLRYDGLPGEDPTTLLALGVTGTDSNGDVTAINFTFLDAAGDDFDFVGEGGDLTFTFGLEEAANLATFMEATFVGAGPTADYAAGAVGFRISLVDAAGLESDEIEGDITAGTFSDDGEACAFTEFCDPAAMLICGDTDVCEAAPAP